MRPCPAITIFPFPNLLIFHTRTLILMNALSGPTVLYPAYQANSRR